MSRLIDLINKQYALASVCSGLIRTIDGEDWIRVSNVRESIMNAPTIDAVPVVHGHWKGYRFPKYRGNDDFGEPIFKEYVAYTCSNCRKQNAIRHKYCPMCGAIMDEVTE